MTKLTVLQPASATWVSTKFVNKNLNEVYNSWRLQNPLSLSEVDIIEESCLEMMDLYGYEKVSGSKENFENINLEFVLSSNVTLQIRWISWTDSCISVIPGWIPFQGIAIFVLVKSRMNFYRLCRPTCFRLYKIIQFISI